MNHSGLVDLVHITNPEDIGSGLPPSTSEDAGKVLKVDAQGTPGWGEDAMATVDQNYDSTSTHAQSGIAVAQALSDVKEVPAVGSSDDGKVLKATYSGGTGSYSWETETGATYTAGDAVSITDNEISVNYDTNTLDVVGQTVTENVTQQSSSGLFALPSSVAALLSQQTNTQVTVHIPANMLRDVNFDYSEEPSITFRFTLYATDSTSETNVSLFSTALSWENTVEYGLIDEQDIVFNLPANVANQWGQSLSSAVAFSICGQRTSRPLTDSPVELFGDLSTDPITFTFVDASAPQKLAVKNPLPASTSADSTKVLTVNAQGTPAWANTQLPEEKSLASTNNTISITEGATTVSIDVTNPLPSSTSADEDKVLTVNAQGAAEWATAQSGPTYTAGVGVDITAGVVSADIDGVTIKQASTTTSTSINGSGSGNYASNGGYIVDPGQDIVSKLYLLINNGGSATIHIPGNTFYFTNNMSSNQVVLSFTSYYHDTSEQRNLSGYATALSTATYDPITGRTWVDEQDVVLEGPADFNPNGNWINASAVMSRGVAGIGISYKNINYVSTQWAYASDYGTAGHLLQYVETATSNKIAVANPLPASTSADENKVLTVNAQGAAEWATSQGGGGSSDVFIVEDSTTQGDVYTAYTSGKVLFYKASSGEMYYMSSNQFSTSYQLYLFGAYVGGYGSRATVVHFDAYINLANGAPVAPTAPFSSALGNIETIQTPPPLPTYSTTTDVGKVLQVTANGIAWVSLT